MRLFLKPTMDEVQYLTTQPKKYIAYVGQDCNFQSRAMLIPSEEFTNARKEECLILKEHSKAIVATIKEKTYHIPNILIQNYLYEENYGIQVETPYTQTCNMLTHYADGGSTVYDFKTETEMQGYADMKDEEWFTKTIRSEYGIPFGRGFNHFACFLKLMNMKVHEGTPINVIDGFLVLESNNGKLNISEFDTVTEMMHECYFKDAIFGE